MELKAGVALSLSKGYKQTEFGVIPSDWEEKEFVEVMDGFSSGQTPYRAIPEFYRGDIPWITSGELNYNIIIDTIEKITIEGAREANLKMIPKGTFLFAITGLEAAGTRGSCAITGIEATTNQSCMALYPKKGLLITSYLYHYYVRYGDELAFKYCQGTKQQSYTGAIAKKLPIVVPPTIEEQTAIATALSDADALISSLEKLIAKKRNIKQGAMQKLLEPNEGDGLSLSKGWVVKKLGEVCEIYRGGSPRPIESYLTLRPDGINWIKIGDVRKNAKYIESTEEKIIPDGLSRSRFVNKGDFILSNSMSFGRPYIMKINGCIHDGWLVIQNYQNHFDRDFLYYVLGSEAILQQYKSMASGSSVLNLNKEIVKSVIINCPKSVEEQARIAITFSDMDAEITALETKLEKYKKVKLGMMQNLLTGKIRLV